MSFCVLDDFFRFSKIFGFWVFLVHPTVVLVLLSAPVKRCFVSRMRDFSIYTFNLPVISALQVPVDGMMAALAERPQVVLTNVDLLTDTVVQVHTCLCH